MAVGSRPSSAESFRACLAGAWPTIAAKLPGLVQVGHRLADMVGLVADGAVLDGQIEGVRVLLRSDALEAVDMMRGALLDEAEAERLALALRDPPPPGALHVLGVCVGQVGLMNMGLMSGRPVASA